MEENFVRLASLIGDPARAAMLWNLLDGRAYTAGELASCADLSASAASHHLAQLVKEGLLTIERQGRHKYFGFANSQIASVIEAMGTLAFGQSVSVPKRIDQSQGLRYCRRCYDHLAGRVGVSLTQRLIENGFIRHHEAVFDVLEPGIAWLDGLGISTNSLAARRRPLARPCLDWSERKVHLAGSLGQALLTTFLERDWLRMVSGSRALVVTSKGHQQLDEQLGISL